MPIEMQKVDFLSKQKFIWMTLILILPVLLSVAQSLTQQTLTTKFVKDTRIVGGQKVDRREDFPYQVKNILWLFK